MVFQAINTTLMTQLAEIVRMAILYWEARIDVEDITVQPDATVDGLVLITVYYVIRKTNARNNLVYPFYIQEATIPVEGP
jgi:phage baseplate assembly protein W